jgi:hypothetical protein
MNVRLIVPNVLCRSIKRPQGDNYHAGDRIAPEVEYGPRIADIAGGFTATQATGGWKDIGDGELIVEPVTVFDCTREPDPTCYPGPLGIADMFRTLAVQIARDLSQTCVYLEIDGVVEYIRPSWDKP